MTKPPKSPLAFLLPLLVGLGLAAGSPAEARKFDIIIVDRPVFFVCLGCALRVQGADFIWIANTGTMDITEQEISDAELFVTVDNQFVFFQPFLNPFRGPVGPVHPGEVVGWASPINSIMLFMVGADETHRQAGPIFGLDVARQFTFDGPFQAEIGLRIGDHEARFNMLADLRTAPQNDVWFNAATRVSAFPLVTRSSATTWGALKRLYR